MIRSLAGLSILLVGCSTQGPPFPERAGADAASVRRELDAVGSRIFLVNPAWPLARSFAEAPGWRPAMRVEAAGQPILVYVSTP